MKETISKTNVFYGGLDPQIDNVFFTHGEMDPRRSLGPSEDINIYSPVVVMPRECCLKLTIQITFSLISLKLQFNRLHEILDQQLMMMTMTMPFLYRQNSALES